MSAQHPNSHSLARRLVELENSERSRCILDEFTDEEKKLAVYTWELWARPNQLPPDTDWRYWFLCAGRGFGKTRTGAEWVRRFALDNPGSRIMVAGPTLTDVRETMFEGDSGLLSVFPLWEKVKYKPSRLLIILPNGSRIKGYSAEKPGRLRGPNIHAAWLDEIADWKDPHSFRNVRLCLRKGQAKCVITGTPRAVSSVKLLFERNRTNPEQVAITHGSTWENQENLSEEFKANVAEMIGTRIGDEELEGRLITDVEGAQLTLDLIYKARLEELPKGEVLVAKAICLDPAMSSNKDSDEHGILAIGIGSSGTGYILGDYSLRSGPSGWIEALRRAQLEHGINHVIYEKNRAGDMIGETLRRASQKVMPTPGNPHPPKPLVFAKLTGVYSSESKTLRFEPLVPLYANGRIKHLGIFAKYEDQCTSWVPGQGRSPDRMDAAAIGFGQLLPAYKARTAKDKPAGW